MLLSTNTNLCGYTHHNAHPPISSSIRYPPIYCPPIPTRTIHPLSSHSSTSRKYTLSCHHSLSTPPAKDRHPPATTHPLSHHQDPSSRLKRPPPPPSKLPPPLPSTPHKDTHTKISKTPCTHPQPKTTKKYHKAKNKLATNLPTPRRCQTAHLLYTAEELTKIAAQNTPPSQIQHLHTLALPATPSKPQTTTARNPMTRPTHTQPNPANRNSHPHTDVPTQPNPTASYPHSTTTIH